MNEQTLQTNYEKIAIRKEAKLRKRNCPIPTEGEKNSMDIIEYIHHLDEMLKEDIVMQKPRMFVAVDMGDEECAICLDKIVDGEDVSHYKCQHYMHSNCLWKWENGCPLCRNKEIDLVFN